MLAMKTYLVHQRTLETVQMAIGFRTESAETSHTGTHHQQNEVRHPTWSTTPSWYVAKAILDLKGVRGALAKHIQAVAATV